MFYSQKNIFLELISFWHFLQKMWKILKFESLCAIFMKKYLKWKVSAVPHCASQKWFKKFSNSDTNIEDQPHSSKWSRRSKSINKHQQIIYRTWGSTIIKCSAYSPARQDQQALSCSTRIHSSRLYPSNCNLRRNVFISQTQASKINNSTVCYQMSLYQNETNSQRRRWYYDSGRMLKTFWANNQEIPSSSIENECCCSNASPYTIQTKEKIRELDTIELALIFTNLDDTETEYR